MAKKTIHQIITKNIIKKLEEGTIPWNMPFIQAYPKNIITKNPYKGINVLMLWAYGSEFKSSYWLTLKQANKLGGRILKNSVGVPIIYWIFPDPDDPDCKITHPYPRYYKVFNLDQCEGIDKPKETVLQDTTPIKECERVVKNYKNKPSIETHPFNACYIPSQDKIQIPDMAVFNSKQEYYSTLFHELVHSTGHKKRLNRFEGSKEHFNRSSKEYSLEELVAELGACFLCTETGISNKTIDNSASYINHWVQAFKRDTKILLKASSKASKAVDYILNKKTDSNK